MTGYDYKYILAKLESIRRMAAKLNSAQEILDMLDEEIKVLKDTLKN